MTAAQIRATREAWLEAAIDALRPRFTEIGLPLPDRIHVSVGFGYGARRENGVILGQCWARQASADSVNHIFVSPEIAKTSEVARRAAARTDSRRRRLCLWAQGPLCRGGDSAGFGRAHAAGAARDSAQAELICLAETLGDYPHGALHPVVQTVPVDPSGQLTPGRVHSGPRKQSTRMLKVVCPCCGYVVRTTAKWLEVGAPRCPAGTQMQAV